MWIEGKEGMEEGRERETDGHSLMDRQGCAAAVSPASCLYARLGKPYPNLPCTYNIPNNVFPKKFILFV